MEKTPYKLSWIPDIPDNRDFRFEPKTATIPNSVRLVWVPGAFNQGDLGSCVSNAVNQAVRFCRIKQRKLYDFPLSRLFNYYNSRRMRGWQDWDTGAYIRDGIKSAVRFGSLDEKLWPYDTAKFAQQPPDSVYSQALNDQALVYRRLDNTNLQELKACLAEGYPFVFGFTIYNDFAWNDPHGVVNLPGRGTYAIGGHASLSVAFDDGSQRFQFLNSWGREWGIMGRGTIPYTYLTDPNLANDFWVISAVE